ncbi:Protein-tyrosine-phosphatase [Verrucomicrobium sp. GAS474]|uniref:arsenate reductase ArsC n=1 Tax=Verrucomicrobium sp. GAS474 TaxID=1882831 RepID=UPI00087ADC8F|nr:arsenate reductase ArsC [Verrucomicrobium sp. GAS474]SDU28324.1 Protein-tyrosine-phosphatase [Verrucomicrobium sp. GAS474]
MLPPKPKILFLCTGNSARSILAEFILRHLSKDRFEIYSAGVRPAGEVNPLILRHLREVWKIDASAARSKSVNDLPVQHFDFVITVCDEARKDCPAWPGQPVIAHWGVPDPAQFTGSEEEKLEKIAAVSLLIRRRLELFISLPLEKMDHLRLETTVSEIAQGAK